MSWILKKKMEGRTLNGMKKPLDELSQKEIKALKEGIRNSLFIEEKPKKIKKDDSSK